MNRGYVITGTDTGIGKTVVAAGLTGCLGASYWKPIQAGLDGETDSRMVARLAGPRLGTVLPEAYRLTSPCSPHQAARIDGVTISLPSCSLPDVETPLVVEGAGGVMVPVNEGGLMLHLFARWALPVILVARTALGTINHSLLSIAALRGNGLDIAGIVFVGDPDPASETAVATFGNVRHLGRLPWLDPLSPETLSRAMRENIRLDLLA